jgi:hypothetical protein
MSVDLGHDEDRLEERLKEAVDATLHELGLDSVSCEDVLREAASTKLAVSLVQRQDGNSSHHTFDFWAEEPLTDDPSQRLSVSRLKPYVRREIEKLFPQG